MSLSNESDDAKNEQLNLSPNDQLTSIQQRLSSLESQIKEIELDLPPNISKSILNMQKEIQKLTEISDSQPEKECPYVYSETAEKICDFQRRIEWKIKDTFQNKTFDANFQLEENDDSPQESENSETPQLHSKISESLENLKLNANKAFEENRKNLDELESQLIQLKFKIKTASNAPSKITTHISNEVDLQQRQINELERTLKCMPNLINNSHRLTDKFSGLSQHNENNQSNTTNNNEKIDNQNANDLSIHFSILESEVQQTISSLQLDLENILKRIDIVDQKSDENEKQIMKITDSQEKTAEKLSDIEDKAVSMIDKAEELTSNFNTNSITAPLEEVDKETRKQLRTFKRDIYAIKSAISKNEAQIAQKSLSKT